MLHTFFSATQRVVVTVVRSTPVPTDSDVDITSRTSSFEPRFDGHNILSSFFVVQENQQRFIEVFESSELFVTRPKVSDEQLDAVGHFVRRPAFIKFVDEFERFEQEFKGDVGWNDEAMYFMRLIVVVVVVAAE